MPTDQQIADLCLGIYAYSNDAPVLWDYLSDQGGFSGVYFGIKYLDDADIVIFRGTADPAEWLINFDFVIAPEIDVNLGRVHAGFLIGMAAVWQRVRQLRRNGKQLWIGGHSLGAARADVLCGYAALDGDVPDGRVVFGEPYPGFESFCSMLKPIQWQSSYCNGDDKGHDLVTNVPLVIPKRFPYTRPTPLIHISEPPLASDEWGMFRYHHMMLYQKAPGKRSQPQPSVTHGRY